MLQFELQDVLGDSMKNNIGKIIAITLVVLIGILVIINPFNYSSIYEEFLETGVVTDEELFENTWKKFGETQIDTNEYFFFAYVSDEYGEEFNLCTAYMGGFKDKEKFSSGSAISWEVATNPKYEYLKAYPMDYRSHKGEYVLWYAGIVPDECEQIEIDGQLAIMDVLQFDYKNTSWAIKVFHLITTSKVMPEEYVDMLVVKEDGKKYQVISSELEESTLQLVE